MPSFSRNDVVLVRYPFSDLTGAKVRPAVVVNAPHISRDVLIVPLTSRTASPLPGEFVLTDWRRAGLNVPTAAKRGIFTIIETLVIVKVGVLAPSDAQTLERSLRFWLALGVSPSPPPAP